MKINGMGTLLKKWRVAVVALAWLAIAAGSARAAEITVLVSGAFTEAYQKLVPEFERATGHNVTTAYGASQGGARDSIPSRLSRGEPADVVIMAAGPLEDLIRAGQVRSEGRRDLVRSSIGMVVRAGARRSDISTVEALRRTLLEARSIAYSASASGTYLSGELFGKLGVAEAIAGKSRRVESERVAAVVARGEAEIGFQQVSELLPVAGVDYVGPLPEGAQRVTVFAAGVTAGTKELEAARALIGFLGSEGVRGVVERSGLEWVGR